MRFKWMPVMAVSCLDERFGWCFTLVMAMLVTSRERFLLKSWMKTTPGVLTREKYVCSWFVFAGVKKEEARFEAKQE